MQRNRYAVAFHLKKHSTEVYKCVFSIQVECLCFFQVNQLKGIPRLVQLFNSENQEVQRYATGATRNLIYENMENKVALIEAGGIPKLIQALKEQDDELRKNITGGHFSHVVLVQFTAIGSCVFNLRLLRLF